MARGLFPSSEHQPRGVQYEEYVARPVYRGRDDGIDETEAGQVNANHTSHDGACDELLYNVFFVLSLTCDQCSTHRRRSAE